jgi:hypothetical protein
MLKNKIFDLVKEKFEDVLREEINNRFEVFEVGLEENRNLQGYDGFIPFVDGFVCLSSVINSSYLIISGNAPNYLEKYINYVNNSAIEYSNENAEDNEELKDDIYMDYILDDCFYVECNFYFYDKDGKGDGINSLYFDYSIKDEYGKSLYLVDIKAIDEVCITNSEVSENNYIEIINNAVEKIKKFI